MVNVRIAGTEVYHPPFKVSNEQLAEQAGEAADKLIGIWKHFGRKDRYYATTYEESTLYMAIQASKALLASSGLSGEDLDMIVVSSGTHEYSAPTDAALLHQAIGGKQSCIVYDSNANCVGMVVAADQAARSMMTNPELRYALIVGSEQIARFYKEGDLASKGLCGDAACAVLLKRVEEGDCGLIDSAYYTNTQKAEDMLYPSAGMTQMFGEHLTLEEKKIYLHPEYNVNVAFPTAVTNIENLLHKHRYAKREVKHYILSQLNLSVIKEIAGKLNEDEVKFPYIGDVYGYTGTSSPFITLHHAIKDGTLVPGDLFFMWSVGAGITSCATLWRL
ncbi:MULTISPECIES: ketoacyl-ACP synthase III [unclassified Paenibacillus]|uniref:ketoacyl-ACP synthase III n=1 Tax=unclassified Paenibacillus TaxID=185978 RepID=UPI0024060FAD|nr:MULTISPECIES: ketoacyl-ACP synthase III [unclassified Paenibacillus]MDF9839009.1 3-oxoacyl-[acyl-carrier-protein] synthase-3 [Paenibacillus sp. PastF-2]MDF9845591.1 3-oxoacyl-[acyl-carrier-protein] synthase-3 [Paenibacillus sp. PastM-2]MDF9852162.1 3-oxoacyl-[acyl-carrier-protein] synthase-3 [Paenibacillus sp. PastF-1]MDH6478108.1 3-oxoacyl-[acyl-carrier-protein] synthase-3 [Paenibacillus sp. PastH-2]MDH6505842.1 3-oxoacyl-[acyl-carrier-protein] synthase-3 [Paenibacillus sp. PastM-3]